MGGRRLENCWTRLAEPQMVGLSGMMIDPLKLLELFSVYSA